MWQAAKIGGLFILTGLSIAGGIVACVTVKCLVVKLGTSQKFKRTISVLNCFAGGVFFATSILDILPEGREQMEKAKVDWGWDTGYPLTEVLMGVGFLLILAMEHGAYTCFHLHTASERNKIFDKAPPNHLETPSRDVESPVMFSKANQKSNGVDANGNQNGVAVQDCSCFNNGTYKTFGGAVDASLDKTSTFTPEPKPKPAIAIIHENSDQTVINQAAAVPNSTQHVTTTIALKSLLDKTDDKQHSIRGIILLAALSLHMIFDGLAVGLLQDTTKIWNLVLAISVHKTLVFYTIGLQILELLKSLPKAIIAICLFALITPIGMIIGELIGGSGDDSVQQSATAILQALAAGTFIYVTFFEILQREFGDSVHNMWKVLVTIVGFALIAVIRLLEHEDDD